MIAYHEVRDAEKLQSLIASMESNGWQGAPLVAIGDELITGSHRYAAWREVFDTDYGLPVVQLADIFEESGLDLDATMEEENYELVWVLEALSHEVREEYGIDVH